VEVGMSSLERQPAPNFNLEGSDGKRHFTLLSDPHAEVMRSYGAWGERKDQEGKTAQGAMRSTVVIGRDGKVLRHWTPVSNAEAHPQQVLHFLDK